jgi:AraC-like DNA-binding protein
MGATIGHSRDASQAEREARPLTSEPMRSNSVTARTVFTTEGLPPSRQFDAYREYCAPVIEIAPNEEPGSGFDAVCEMWQLGRFGFRRICTPAGRFRRSDAQVRRDGLDHWVFNVLRSGEQEARTTTSELRTGAGELSVFSLAGAYQARRTRVDWVGLFVPRGAFPAIDASLDHNQHRALDNYLGRLLAAYLIALADELPTMKEDDLPRALQAMQVLVEGPVASSSAVLDSGDTCLDLPRTRLLRDIIDRNLGSWNLHAGRLCKLADISRSNLYRMFEPYGGVVRYIQRQRLRRTHDLLADPTCTRKISLIANDYCFSDSSTFSRAFRHEFGYSPTDLRRHTESGGAAFSKGRLTQGISAGGSWELLFNS